MARDQGDSNNGGLYQEKSNNYEENTIFESKLDYGRVSWFEWNKNYI